MYYSIEEMLEMIDGPNRSACKKLLKENEKLFREAPGSSHNHQAWRGGYWDHVQEAMNWAIEYYNLHRSKRGRLLEHNLSDALLVLFLHDLEKPWKYEKDARGKFKNRHLFKTKADNHEFRLKKIRKYGIRLTPEQENGVKYVEGENDDYTNKERIMWPLAAFCHICDITSARIYFRHQLEHDHPFFGDDPWPGAERQKKPKTKTSR